MRGRHTITTNTTLAHLGHDKRCVRKMRANTTLAHLGHRILECTGRSGGGGGRYDSTPSIRRGRQTTSASARRLEVPTTSYLKTANDASHSTHTRTSQQSMCDGSAVVLVVVVACTCQHNAHAADVATNGEGQCAGNICNKQ